MCYFSFIPRRSACIRLSSVQKYHGMWKLLLSKLEYYRSECVHFRHRRRLHRHLFEHPKPALFRSVFCVGPNHWKFPIPTVKYENWFEHSAKHILIDVDAINQAECPGNMDMVRWTTTDDTNMRASGESWKGSTHMQLERVFDPGSLRIWGYFRKR